MDEQERDDLMHQTVSEIENIQNSINQFFVRAGIAFIDKYYDEFLTDKDRIRFDSLNKKLRDLRQEERNILDWKDDWRVQVKGDDGK